MAWPPTEVISVKTWPPIAEERHRQQLTGPRGIEMGKGRTGDLRFDCTSERRCVGCQGPAEGCRVREQGSRCPIELECDVEMGERSEKIGRTGRGSFIRDRLNYRQDCGNSFSFLVSQRPSTVA